MVSTVFAPPGPAAGSARQVTNPNTGNSYAFNGQGAAVVADADTPWFLTQGYTTTPDAGSGVVVYAPLGPDQAPARRVTNRNTGNSYVFNGYGAAAVATADLPWFLSQGYVQLPSGTVMQEPLQPSQASPGVIVNPATGNTYVVNGRGFIVAQAADVSWLQTLGFAPVTGGTPVLTRFSVSAPSAATAGTPFSVTVTALDQFGATFPGYAGTVHFTSTDGAAVLPANSTLTAGVGTFSATLNTAGNQTITATDTVTTSVTGTSGVIAASTPAFPPQVGGVNPTLFGDFAGSQYWAAGAVQPSFAAWMTAIGATYSRASTATYLQAGVVQTAAANVARFPTSLAGVPQGIRLTGAQTELCLQNRDLTNTSWTKTNVTAAKDQTGADSVANAASSLIATAANATALQSITDGSSVRTMGAYVKRITGSGAINITQDNGSTWTPITITGAWSFYSLPSATLANPVIGFRIVTNGDAIAVDYVSERDAAFISDVIPTTTATVTQAADSFTFPFTQTTFTALVKSNNQAIVPANGVLFGGSGTGSNAYIFIQANNTTNFSTYNAVTTLSSTYAGGLTPSHKTAISGSGAGRSITTDGAVPVTDGGSLTAVTPTVAGLGNYGSTSISPVYGNIEQFGTWNGIVASSADLIGLTT
ncbi:MAG TPA: hypothetical protein VGF39_15765 [Stellaceae bacterium]